MHPDAAHPGAHTGVAPSEGPQPAVGDADTASTGRRCTRGARRRRCDRSDGKGQQPEGTGAESQHTASTGPRGGSWPHGTWLGGGGGSKAGVLSLWKRIITAVPKERETLTTTLKRNAFPTGSEKTGARAQRGAGWPWPAGRAAQPKPRPASKNSAHTRAALRPPSVPANHSRGLLEDTEDREPRRSAGGAGPYVLRSQSSTASPRGGRVLLRLWAGLGASPPPQSHVSGALDRPHCRGHLGCGLRVWFWPAGRPVQLPVERLAWVLLVAAGLGVTQGRHQGTVSPRSPVTDVSSQGEEPQGPWGTRIDPEVTTTQRRKRQNRTPIFTSRRLQHLKGRIFQAGRWSLSECPEGGQSLAGVGPGGAGEWSDQWGCYTQCEHRGRGRTTGTLSWP